VNGGRSSLGSGSSILPGRPFGPRGLEGSRNAVASCSADLKSFVRRDPGEELCVQRAQAGVRASVSGSRQDPSIEAFALAKRDRQLGDDRGGLRPVDQEVVEGTARRVESR
jgi:hypothetical protein